MAIRCGSTRKVALLSTELVPVCRDERAFYELVGASSKMDDVDLKELIPVYYGCQEIKVVGGEGKECCMP